MVIILDTNQCRQDSPKFRAEIELVETSTERFGDALRKAASAGKVYIDSEKNSISLMKSFCNEIVNIANIDGNYSYENESEIVSAINRLAHLLNQLSIFREELITEMESVLIIPCQRFSLVNVAEMKRTRQKFDNDYEAYENELFKYCSLSKKKATTEEGGNITQSLRSSRKSFLSTSIAYCEKLNEITAFKKVDFVNDLLSFVHSTATTYNKSFKLLEEASPSNRELALNLQDIKSNLIREKQQEHEKGTMKLEDGTHLFDLNLSPPIGVSHSSSAESQSSATSSTSSKSSKRDSISIKIEEPVVLEPLEGYLLKKSSGARKVWSRRYFCLNIEECRLDYMSPKTSDNLNVALNLQNANFKELDLDDRRFVFQITSTTNSYILQAESEGEMEKWKSAILSSIAAGPKTVVQSPRNSIPSFPSIFGMKSLSSRGSFEGEENHIETGFIRSGDLYFKKDTKKSGIKTISRGTAISDSTSSGSEWKKVYTSLSRDSRLILFDFESEKDKDKEKDKDNKEKTPAKGTIKKPLLTKVLASIDLANIEMFSIQAVHESVSGRKHSFCVVTKDRKYYFSGGTELERDDWLLCLNKHILEKRVETSRLRTTNHIDIDIVEAKNIPAGDVYVDIRLDDWKLATTSVKPKTSTPYWGESFSFDDVKEAKDGLILTLKHQNRVQKDVAIGYYFVSTDSLLQSKVEGWVPLQKGSIPKTPNATPDANSQKGDLKIEVRYQSLDIMQLKNYDQMSQLLDAMEAVDMFDLVKASDHLERTSKNLLRIYIYKGAVIPWLKGIVEKEIKSTDEINIMFRANSIATKAIDQFMKIVGANYLEETIGEVIKNICESKSSTEVDPTKLQKGEDINQNWTRLIFYVTQIWNSISKSSEQLPNEMKVIFQHIQLIANEKFGHDEKYSSVRYTTVSGFLFLRFFCPAILTPKLFGLLPEHPDERTRRTLTLITKTLQCLANLGSFGVKESFMGQMNEFLMDQTTSMMDFIDKVSICTQEPSTVTYPIDIEKEFAELQQYVSIRKEDLKSKSSPNIQKLIAIVEKLDSKLDSLNRVSLGAFLKE